jgi:Domain of unknown function (DUF1905)/Bacteriocin-protection, YdeI or OmpD-Associated
MVEKMEGKGGWTYVKILNIRQHANRPFGMVRVKGFVDDYVLKQFSLMPMGDGSLFLSLNAALRKQIKKGKGDTVHIRLATDETPLEIPQEFLDCLAEVPKAFHFFITLTENQQKYFVDWIYGAKQVLTKEKRIVEAIEKLGQKKKFYEKNEDH